MHIGAILRSETAGASKAIFTLQLSYRCRHRRLLNIRTTAHNFAQLRTTTHNNAQLRTMVDYIVLSIELVFMVLGVSYSRVPITINSMILYFKHVIHIDDFQLNGLPPSYKYNMEMTQRHVSVIQTRHLVCHQVCCRILYTHGKLHNLCHRAFNNS